MQEKAKIPRLRYKNFSGEWKEKKIGSIFEKVEVKNVNR